MRFRCRIIDDSIARSFSVVIHFIGKLWKKVTLRITKGGLHFLCSAGVVDGSPALHIEVDRRIFSQYDLDGYSAEFPEIYLSFPAVALDHVFDTVRQPNVSTVRSVKMQLTNKSGACISIDLELENRSTSKLRQVTHDVSVDVIPQKEWELHRTPQPAAFEAILTMPSTSNFVQMVAPLKADADAIDVILKRTVSAGDVIGAMRFVIDNDLLSFRSNAFNLGIPSAGRVPLVGNYSELVSVSGGGGDRANRCKATLKLKRFLNVLTACEALKAEDPALGISREIGAIYFALQPCTGIQVDVLLSFMAGHDDDEDEE